jgi:hypothetical protein
MPNLITVLTRLQSHSECISNIQIQFGKTLIAILSLRAKVGSKLSNYFLSLPTYFFNKSKISREQFKVGFSSFRQGCQMVCFQTQTQIFLFGTCFPFWYVVAKKSGNPILRSIHDCIGKTKSYYFTFSSLEFDS